MEIKQGSFSNPDDPRMFKHFDFQTDLEIPVVLLFVTREIQHTHGYDPGPELLLLRRGHRVGALKGLWCPVAGVDDHFHADPEVASLLTVIDEAEEETGIVATRESITLLTKNRYQCPEKADRTWVQKLFHIHSNVTRVLIDDTENIGAIWIPLSAIDDLLETGATTDLNLQTVIDDGTKLIEDGNLARFMESFAVAT